jgi:hypothetical protein
MGEISEFFKRNKKYFPADYWAFAIFIVLFIVLYLVVIK